MNTAPASAPFNGDAERLLRDEQRLRQFEQSAARVGNRVCAPGGRELPARYSGFTEDDGGEP